MTTDPLDPPTTAPASPPSLADRAAGLPIVGIGASAGGLEAFTQLLLALPADTGMAFVLVQHLAPSHPSALAEILSRATAMPVAEVIAPVRVEPDHVYVIPPGQNMVIAAGALQLLPRQGHGLHHPIDQFFRALAQDQRHRAIGVVLSGTATDGTLGLEAIKAEGGITFAQDATAQQGSMPHSAIDSGCVDFVLPPDAIARELVRIGRHPHVEQTAAATDLGEEPGFGAVLELLLQASGVDFRHYKSNTVFRRITRRMVFGKWNDLGTYVEHLRRTPNELAALYQDILIGVTSFFRDPGAFAVLASTVFPRLLQNRSRTDPVRIWTLGCSSGQEAYSLAIAFFEAAEVAGIPATLQVFATDINAASIERARAGVYGKDIAADVSPVRLQRFFVEVDGGYRICKTIRDACVFSRHDVLVDPPFSRMDLVSCRNLLIYLDPVLQQRILSMLHYALRPAGCLWLGTSETIGNWRNLFEVADGRCKLFTRRPGTGPGLFPVQHGGALRSPFLAAAARPRVATELPREADRVLLHRFAPPGVLVSAELDILQYRGDTDPWLAPAAGKASLSLMKMLREGLPTGVQAAIRRSEQTKLAARETGLRVKTPRGYQAAAVEVIPLRGQGEAMDGGYLVLFEAVATAGGPAPAPLPAARTASELDHERLEQELAATRDYLQSVIEQQETANEELQSANEEVQSANEELQSTNEELETSKEEIESSNEELATVNGELNERNLELHRSNDDLENLFASVQMVLVMLDPELRVRRFTPLAEHWFHLLPTDVGSRLVDRRLELDGLTDLEPLLVRVRDTARAEELEVRDRRGRWHALRVRPYRTRDKAVDGLIVMLVDIDSLKRSQITTESIVATVHEPLLVLDGELRVRSASRAFHATFGSAPESTLGKVLYELGEREWDLPGLRPLLAAVLEHGEPFSGYEVVNDAAARGKRVLRLNARRLVQAAGEPPSILLAIEDVTDRKQAQAALQVSELRFRRLFEASKDGILILDADSHQITHVNPFLTQLLGYPPSHFLGKELWEIGFLRDKQASQAAMRQITEQGSVRYETMPLEGSDGRLHPVEMVANMYEEDRHRVIQCNIRDIADRSRMEALMRGQAAELSDLHRRKDEFLAMLSHELRSPLAPIANAVRLLGLEHGAESPLQQQARGIIVRQLAQLQHLVDDLLEVSRITTGRLQLRRERVAARDLVEHAVETVRPLLEQRRQALVLSLANEPIVLDADVARLEQVLNNLLTNAIKFTDPGGHLAVSMQLEGDRCVLRVRDDGIGIAPALLPRVFDLFAQGERSLDRSQGGLGIGLALVQRLTELHGGTVEVHSTVGQGSEFVVRLPVVATEVPSPPAAAAPPAVPRPLRVLVVDDNVDTVLSFSMLLQAAGHEVDTAFDGPMAVQTALARRPDVVLLDIGLPGLSGYEVAAQLRLEPSLRGTVLVALTGYGQEADRLQAKQAGFDHHLTKPADFGRLERILLDAAASKAT
ncbi:MAG: ATP-binding protein [Planctomycetes bacterium]|jgi:two-component system CheB/CheR fusion protein|nr:ATP-binding protein [Planctomycetota bacterium]